MVAKSSSNNAANNTPTKTSAVKKSNEQLGFNPWLSIWTKPRQTIKEIISYNPSYLVLPIAAVYGVKQALDVSASTWLGDTVSFGWILAGSLFLGLLLGILSIYISGALMKWTGSWLGGKSSYSTMRTALAWAYVPSIFALILYVIKLPLFGIELFSTDTPIIDSSTGLSAAFIILNVIDFIIIAWSFVISLITISEVQQFSVWKALLNMLITFLIVFIPLLIILTIYFYFSFPGVPL